MIGYFYDIESLSNVFTLVNFKDDVNEADVFYLIDNEDALLAAVGHDRNLFHKMAAERIRKCNKNFSGTIRFFDLHQEEGNVLLARTFGLSDAVYVNNPNAKSSYDPSFRPVCDTDPGYDEEKYPYLFSYNGYNYDTTMISMYLYDVFFDNKFSPTKAALMRQYNDELFSPQFDSGNASMPDRLRYAYIDPSAPARGFGKMNYRDPKAIIRKNMLMSGRHIDTARLNEKQQKVALKRLLGMLGYQILESDKLKPNQSVIETFDQLLDLLGYNVSDCVNLKKLAGHKSYKSAFSLKRQLLKDYPELVYEQKEDAYAPDISPVTVRKDRLCIDSSSAQLATKSLCPYGHLSDYDTVSFMYPSERKAKEYGIPRVNVLEETKKFFYSHFKQPELRARFDEIYNYYKSIEGKNFNSGKNYLIDHGVDPDSFDPESELPPELIPQDLSSIPCPNTCMVYYNKDGSLSSCYVNWSTGGIHGGEFNLELYLYDLDVYETKLKEYNAQLDIIRRVKEMFPNPCDLKIAKGVTLDGVKYTPSKFLKPKATATEAYWKDDPKPPKKPELFKKSPTGKWNVDKRYAYTSADPTNHEDFTSYYPNLLRQMEAFFNPGLGYDRYGEIFDNKTKFGDMMKDPQYTPEQQGLYSTMRNGTKLVLNSASGAGDANFESNIRMNNKIISMRIIGQLFTYRIGQAQTIEGAKITSTNTDGLFTVMEEKINAEILKRESDNIHVEIEPEPIYLISKDSNNRMEVEIEDNNLTKIVNSGGGTLGCLNGPTPDKSLAHPALIDWALAEYLICAATHYKGAAIDQPFVEELGRNIITSARSRFNDDLKALLMFQNVIASSPGSQRFVFATTDDAPDTPIPLQHYNRCFIVKDKTPGSFHLQTAVAKVITDAMIKSRRKKNEKARQHDPIALEILATNGIKRDDIDMNKEATVNKISGVEESWYMLICNSDLHCMTDEERAAILDSLDYEKYLCLLKDAFEDNWMNTSVAAIESAKAAKEAEKAEKAKGVDLFDTTTSEPVKSKIEKPDALTAAIERTNASTNNRLADIANCIIDILFENTDNMIDVPKKLETYAESCKDAIKLAIYRSSAPEYLKFDFEMCIRRAYAEAEDRDMHSMYPDMDLASVNMISAYKQDYNEARRGLMSSEDLEKLCVYTLFADIIKHYTDIMPDKSDYTRTAAALIIEDILGNKPITRDDDIETIRKWINNRSLIGKTMGFTVELRDTITTLLYTAFTEVIANRLEDSHATPYGFTENHILNGDEYDRMLNQYKNLISCVPDDLTELLNQTIDYLTTTIFDKDFTKLLNQTTDEVTDTTDDDSTEPTPAESDTTVTDDTSEDAIITEPLLMAPGAPKLYNLKNTIIDMSMIQKAERQLNLAGVRIGAEHDVLKKLIKLIGDIDID